MEVEVRVEHTTNYHLTVALPICHDEGPLVACEKPDVVHSSMMEFLNQ